MEYRTCTYIHDDGGICNSAAVTDRNLCLYHLRHRAQLMRMAQFRARDQRFELKLPPLESMHAVQSALTQLSEALAADMIELKRADRLIRVLNIASRNLLKSDKWPASPYHSDQPAPAVDLAADFGLPADLDLNIPPELAFPPDMGGKGAPPAGVPDERRLSARWGGLSPDFGDRVPHPPGSPTSAALALGGVAYRLILAIGWEPLTALFPPLCPPLTTANTAPAVPSTLSAPTTPKRPNSPSSARSSEPRAWTPLPIDTSNSSATSIGAS